MKASTKGVFLSGLVYPGLGQLVLGSIVAGWFLILFTTAGLVVLIFRLAKRIDVAIDQLLPVLAKDGFDLAIFTEMINRSFDGGWQIEGASSMLILCCWIAAISHAYLLGRKLDRKTH
jgi:TM2 domain-containing membrane protein YozV